MPQWQSILHNKGKGPLNLTPPVVLSFRRWVMQTSWSWFTALWAGWPSFVRSSRCGGTPTFAVWGTIIASPRCSVTHRKATCSPWRYALPHGSHLSAELILSIILTFLGYKCTQWSCNHDVFDTYFYVRNQWMEWSNENCCFLKSV